MADDKPKKKERTQREAAIYEIIAKTGCGRSQAIRLLDQAKGEQPKGD